MKMTVKILTVLLIAVTIISFTTNVFAEINPGDIEEDTSVLNANSEIVAKAGKVTGLIRNVAVIAAVIIIMVLGVKYMLGSVEEKADYKKSFVPLIVGIVVVVAATSIASAIFSIAS